jgi:heme/copper-type cytochrome/quinol oxidase subunit 2
MYIYFGIFSIILLFGLVVTFMVGFSRKNREGDQTYFQKTEVKWVRLTSFYVISIAAGLLALLAYIRYSIG